MHRIARRPRSHTQLILTAAALLAGCGGIGDPGPDRSGSAAAAAGPGTMLPPQSDALPVVAPTPFVVVTVSVPSGAVWQLNRPIDVEFNKDVDFSSVSASTIRIVDGLGAPAVGTFTLPAPRTVRFQPTCPTNEQNSNGGFRQGRAYVLDVPTQGVTVMSTAGDTLQTGANVAFSTPMSNDPAVLFLDVVPGPPRVRVRGLAGEPTNSDLASFVEFGDGTTEFLAFDPVQQAGGLAGEVPLNLYSRAETRFSLVLRFDQPITASASNVNSSFVALEYSYDQVNWHRAPSSVEVIDNCTEIGASVRLRPNGVVPQGASLRGVLRAGFRDLTGEALLVPTTNFAVLGVQLADPGGPNPADGTDEVLERFDIGGAGPGSLEDTSYPSSLPRASWSGAANAGTLEAGFDFDGTGGPGGDFDWRIPTGQTVFLDTAFDQIIGGPNGQPFFIQNIVNGVVDLDDMIMEPGSRLLVLGPNPLTILATGDVTIDGTISVNGGNSFGVQTLNTTNQPEQGAAGRGGGGHGGTGSYFTSQSTPQGGHGNGAFNVPGRGGRGGESGYAPNGQCAKEDRRAAGGGGGKFGSDVFYEWTLGSTTWLRCQTLVGMDGEPGFTGSPDGTGAVTQSAPAVGGALGTSPFRDGRDDNDFYGTAVTASGETIVGELPGVWAGAGGGAGGDASTTATYPMTPFSQTGDEKGAGGGGGAGGIQILAIGDIELGAAGTITADGGHGGAGENVIFFDRVGGGSGGGSGGHIVLSSASTIRIEAEASSPTVGPFYLDEELAATHERRPLSALGGQGGAGRENRCGANESGTTQWRADAIPTEAFEGNFTVPPTNWNVWQLCNQISSCSVINTPEGVTPGAGGDGSPGIIQLHVTDPATQLLFPNASGIYGAGLDPTRSMAPPPLGWTAPNQPVDTMVPFVSARSASFSRWISLGLARLEPPNGAVDQVELEFAGTDPATGEVLRGGTAVVELAPLFDYAALSIGGAAPAVDVPSATFTIPGAGIDDLYRENAALTREFAVRVRDANSVTNVTEFIVQTGGYDGTSDTFALVVDPRGTELADVIAMTASPEVALVPFFFRVVTAGVSDTLPVGTSIKIGFDATILDPQTGEPSTNPADAFSGGVPANFATDIGQLNAAAWDLFRFSVEFDLDSAGTGIDVGAPRPALDFLRVPYRF